MRVSAGYRRLSVSRGERFGVPVGDRQHLTVQDFHSRETGGEVVKIALGAAAGQARKDMIHAEQQPPLIQVGGKSGQVVAAPLQLDVVLLGDVINAHVQ